MDLGKTLEFAHGPLYGTGNLSDIYLHYLGSRPLAHVGYAQRDANPRDRPFHLEASQTNFV